MKYKMSEMKNILYGQTSRLEFAEEKTSELLDIVIETIQHEIQREKRLTYPQPKPTNKKDKKTASL